MRYDSHEYMIKFATNLKIHLGATIYLLQIYLYFAEVTNIFKHSVIHYINKP